MGYGLRPDRNSPVYADWLAAAAKPGRILHTRRLSELRHSVTPTTASPWIGSVMTGAGPYDSITATFQVPKVSVSTKVDGPMSKINDGRSAKRL